MFRLARFIVTLIAAAWLLTLVGPVLTAHADPDPSPTASATATPTAEPTVTPTAEPTATPPVADPTATPTAEPTAEPTEAPWVPSADYIALYLTPVKVSAAIRAAWEAWRVQQGAASWATLSVEPECTDGPLTSVYCAVAPTAYANWGAPTPVVRCDPPRWVDSRPDLLPYIHGGQVVTGPTVPTKAECSVKAQTKPVAKPAARPVVHTPQIVRIPRGGIAAGDGSTAMPKTLPATGPAVSTWLLLLVALGCFALAGLLPWFGSRTPKPLPLRKDAGAITLPALRRTAALVAACLLGSAGTFLAISQVTNQRIPPLVQAVFTGTQLGPAQSVPFVPGHFYEGSRAWDDPTVWLLPVTLTGYDLPAGAVIRVRTAAGVENCTHSKGSGFTTNGEPVTGDGWTCSRLPSLAR
ncbi:MAG TPA: PT domain-containing protein [Dermatophilaceae bacterium]